MPTVSLVGPKRTSERQQLMSAIGGKADIPRMIAMSDFDPKRTFAVRDYNATQARYLRF
jgi:hypothetical protein